MMTRCLVVDDSPTHAQRLTAILSLAGCEVSVATDGRHALDTLARCPHDIVVTDLNMPVMDGCELVRHIAATHGDIPVVVVTARGSERLAVDALAFGATNFVPKAAMIDSLADVVRSLVAYRNAERSFCDLAGRLRSPELYFKVTSDLKNITPVTTHVLATMAAAGAGDAIIRYRVATAIASAMHNAIVFGNLHQTGKADDTLPPPHDPRWQLAVRVKVSVAPSDTRVSVSCDGDGSISSGGPAPGTPESFETRQCRGLMLMTSFMDEVFFQHNRTEVVMIKRHEPTPAASSSA